MAGPPGKYTISSNNWSGLVAHDNGTTYTEALADWTVPNFKAACPHDSDYAMWPGFGSRTTIIQAGTDAYAGSSGPNAIKSWIELFPGPAYWLNLAINAGDEVYAEIWYTTGDQTMHLTMVDVTQGTGGNLSLTSLGGESAAAAWNGGSWAEIITERAGSSSGLNDLREPTTDTAYYHEGLFNGNDVHASNFDLANMYGNSGVLSYPNNVIYNGSTTWRTDWGGCE